MKEVHAHMTGLESRFEDEMHKLPGWKDELEELKNSEHHESKPKKASKKDRAVEESMVLGQ